MNELLTKLTQCYGPSGNEEKVRDLIISEIKAYSDDFFVDTLGNLIVHRKGSGPKLMFAAHMDEIGVITTFIEKEGFLRFAEIGGVSPHNALFQKVQFKNGVTGLVAYEEKIEEIKDLKFNKMYIDIGAKNREEAEALVNIGDAGCFTGSFIENGGRLISKAMDDRAGCYIMIEALKSISKNDNPDNDLFFVFTVQEELGLRGAKTSAYNVNPDYAISIDVTDTGDTPGSKPMSLKMGAGPAIKVKDSSIITHPFIRRIMQECAEEINVPYQFEVLERGGTDSGAIHLTRSGVPSGVLSIPTRYIHTTTEMVDFDDINNAIKLIERIALSDKFAKLF